MIIKIQVGSTIYVNGKNFVIHGVHMDNVALNGASPGARIVAFHNNECVEVSFDQATLAIPEQSLTGLLALLAN